MPVDNRAESEESIPHLRRRVSNVTFFGSNNDNLARSVALLGNRYFSGSLLLQFFEFSARFTENETVIFLGDVHRARRLSLETLQDLSLGLQD